MMEAKILRLEAASRGESKGKSPAGQKPDAATEKKLQKLEAQVCAPISCCIHFKCSANRNGALALELHFTSPLESCGFA